ncbi:MAG: hypothetical protein QM564_00140 [Bergeyella sp.]
MNKVYFKYKEHPGDFFRNTDIAELPNPQKDLESFLVQFLPNYQSDERIAFLDDLYKLIDDDFFDEKDKVEFVHQIGIKSNAELKTDIQLLENDLKQSAFKNFYNLVQQNKIEIIDNGKEQ